MDGKGHDSHARDGKKKRADATRPPPRPRIGSHPSAATGCVGARGGTAASGETATLRRARKKRGRRHKTAGCGTARGLARPFPRHPRIVPPTLGWGAGRGRAARRRPCRAHEAPSARAPRCHGSTLHARAPPPPVSPIRLSHASPTAARGAFSGCSWARHCRPGSDKRGQTEGAW